MRWFFFLLLSGWAFGQVDADPNPETIVEIGLLKNFKAKPRVTKTEKIAVKEPGPTLPSDYGASVAKAIRSRRQDLETCLDGSETQKKSFLVAIEIVGGGQGKSNLSGESGGVIGECVSKILDSIEYPKHPMENVTIKFPLGIERKVI